MDFRLRALHPYLHLLQSGPKLESEIVFEAEARYGWRERRARDHFTSLHQLRDADDQPVIAESQKGHRKRLELVGVPVHVEREAP